MAIGMKRRLEVGRTEKEAKLVNFSAGIYVSRQFGVSANITLPANHLAGKH